MLFVGGITAMVRSLRWGGRFGWVAAAGLALAVIGVGTLVANTATTDRVISIASRARRRNARPRGGRPRRVRRRRSADGVDPLAPRDGPRDAGDGGTRRDRKHRRARCPGPGRHDPQHRRVAAHELRTSRRSPAPRVRRHDRTGVAAPASRRRSDVARASRPTPARWRSRSSCAIWRDRSCRDCTTPRPGDREVRVEADTDLRASIDARWLAEATRQGIENALKFSPVDTPIDLSVRARRRRRPDRGGRPRPRHPAGDARAGVREVLSVAPATATRIGPARGSACSSRDRSRARTRATPSSSTVPMGVPSCRSACRSKGRRDGERSDRVPADLRRPQGPHRRAVDGRRTRSARCRWSRPPVHSPKKAWRSRRSSCPTSC